MLLLLLHFGIGSLISQQLLLIYFLDQHLLVWCNVLLGIGVVIGRIGLFLILNLTNLLIATLVAFMRNHILRRGLKYVLLDQSGRVLNFVNRAYSLCTLRRPPRALGWRIHLFLGELLVQFRKLLWAFGLPAVLKIAVVLVDCFDFPRLTLSCIPNILVLNLLILKILKRLRVPMQLKLVVLETLSIKIMLQIV